MPDLTSIALVSLVGALLALDRAAAFQTMISRPLAAGPVVGFLLGEPGMGVVVGAFFELVWMGRLPLGGHLPPNECLAAVVSTAAIILAGRGEAPPRKDLVVLGFLLGPPVAHLGANLEKQVRMICGRLSRKAQEAAAAGRPGRIHWFNQAGLAFSFLAFFLYLALALPLVHGLLSLISPNIPAFLGKALGLTYYLLPLVGVSAALSSVNVRRHAVAYAVCFAGGLVLLAL